MSSKIVAIIKIIQLLIMTFAGGVAIAFIIVGIIGIGIKSITLENNSLLGTNSLLEIIAGILLLILRKLYFADFKIHNKDK